MAMEPPPKRLRHAAPLFLGGMRFDWRNAYGTDASADKRAGAAVAAWLKDVAAYDGDVTVAIEETASCLVGTARFHGHGDAPFVAARAVLGRCAARDPSNDMLMFQEVKQHHGFARAEKARLAEAAREAAVAAIDVPHVAARTAREPWPDTTWHRALEASGARPGFLAFGRPLVHKALAAARAQCERERDEGRVVWAFDLPAGAGGGGPKRFLAATPAEFDAAYALVPPAERHVYEVIDASRPCWAYFDLEFSRAGGLNAEVDGNALTERVVLEACAALRAAANGPSLEVEVVVLASERDTKFSRHVVLRPHRTDGARRPAPLAGSRDAGRLAAKVSSALGSALHVQSTGAGACGNFVDARVYSSERCFRVAGSTKYGDDGRAAFTVRDRWLVRGRGLEDAARPFAPSQLRESLVVPALARDFAAECIALG